MESGFLPEKFDEEGKPTLYRWDSNAFRASMTPVAQRNWDRRGKVIRAQIKLSRSIPWMRWPILNYVYSFWGGILEEGVVAICKPRWGGVTFGWLNDGMKPSLWHTWRQLTHNHVNDKYTGIYPRGAPKSLKQAQEWEKEYDQKEFPY